MASTPNPRSYSQILGGMVNAFLSRLGLPSIKNGDPSLSLMEAAAQSDFRASQDVLKTLSIRNLNSQSGTALDATGREEKVFRISDAPSSGFVSFGDSAVTKIQTLIYQAGTGVAAGTTALVVEDASGFTATGSLFIGRGTANYEGPIAYTAVAANVGGGWTISLSAPVQNFHQLGEPVTLSQGGERLIPAGTIVSTPVSSAGGQVQFRTLFTSIIPDGEASITSVPVECTTNGLAGNVGVGMITNVVSPPFTTCTVTNSAPLSNGTTVEDDDTFRERIRLARKSRSKAINSAIVNVLLGARAVDESGQISSVSTLYRPDEPRTIYIDDGTGYEEKDEGIRVETLLGSAVGGEQFFALSNRPVAKAYLLSAAFPQSVTSDIVLSVYVGGRLQLHTFGLGEFSNPASASAYEAAASINSNPTLSFSARTVSGGSRVAIYAKNESEEDIRVVDGGANNWLKFSTQHQFTLYLFKNDVILSEDGALASIRTKLQPDWDSIVSGDDLSIEVDGIPLTAIIYDSDFGLLTQYTTVSQTNSLESWATVLNQKLPGVTVTVENGLLVLTSNRGRNDRASIEVVGGTLLSAMFSSTDLLSLGQTSDYVLDRHSAQIKLAVPLAAGDKLSAGSLYTRAFLELDVGALSIAGPETSVTGEIGAEIWLGVDGNVGFRETSVGIGSTVTWANTASAWGVSVDVSSNFGSSVRVGDWLIVTDEAVVLANRGAFRINSVTVNSPTSTTVRIERSASTAGSYTLVDGGVEIVRCDTTPSRIYIPDGTNYTPTSLATIVNSFVTGATAAPYATRKLRIRTNRADGQLAVLGANRAGAELFAVSTLNESQNPHFAATVSGHSQLGILSRRYTVDSIAAADSFYSIPDPNASNSVLVRFLKPLNQGVDYNRESNAKTTFTIFDEQTNRIDVRELPPKEFLEGDQWALSRGYDITARDSLSVLLDNDNVSGRYSVPMYRKVKIVSFAGSLLEASETDGNQLQQAFGAAFDWNDFLVSFRARAKTHATPDTSRTILWRWWRHGAEGNGNILQYRYPSSPTQSDVKVTLDDNSIVNVVLASGAARNVSTFRSTAKIGGAPTSLSGGLLTYQFVANLNVSSAVREIRINFTNWNSIAFTPGETVTAGGTATVVSFATVGLTGYLVVSGVTPPIVAGTTITGGTSGASATTASGPYGYTTLTVALPVNVTDHGIPVDQVVYFTPGNGDFLSGPRKVTAVSTTTLSYVDTIATTASAGAIGTVSCDSSGEVTLAGSSTVAGDIFSPGPAFPASINRPVKINGIIADRSWTGQHVDGGPVSTVLSWHSVTGSTAYPLVAKTAAQVATDINDTTKNPNCPVSAVAVGTAGVVTATGIIDKASYETGESSVTLSDACNWIKEWTLSGHHTFNLRYAPTANLTSNADLANEDVRLVPVTAAKVGKWLNSTAVSGIAARGAAYATQDGSVQIESSFIGGESAVQIVGGSANATATAVRGSPVVVGSETHVAVDNNDGLGGLQAVWVQNAFRNDKTVFTAASVLDSIDATTGLVTLKTTDKAWTVIDTQLAESLQIEKEGDLVSLSRTTVDTFPLAVCGDYIKISEAVGTPTPPSDPVSLFNVGIFKIVEVDDVLGTIWIENPNAVEQRAEVGYQLISYNSIVPGNIVTFGTSQWGDNVGTRTVLGIGPSEYQFTLDVSTYPLNTVPSGTIVLGATAAPSFRVTDHQPGHYLRSVGTISPIGASQMLVSLGGLINGTTLTQIGEAFGTTIVPANKLSFAASTVNGLDAYRHNTGLIKEANKLVFGDETNVVDYEGVASGGASYNIAGPVVKRIRVALSVRASGDTRTIRQQVQSAVAAEINKSSIGEPVAISALVAAAESVAGVQAVAVLSPLYNSTNDRIPVQPYEKALVTNLDSDVSVTFVGDTDNR